MATRKKSTQKAPASNHTSPTSEQEEEEAEQAEQEENDELGGKYMHQPCGILSEAYHL